MLVLLVVILGVVTSQKYRDLDLGELWTHFGLSSEDVKIIRREILEKSLGVNGRVAPFFHVEWNAVKHGATAIPLVRILSRKQTKFRDVVVAEGLAGRKLIMLDGEISYDTKGARVYGEISVVPALLFHKKPSRVLMLGGGTGVGAREVLKHSGVDKLIIVDRSETIVAASKNFLPLEDVWKEEGNRMEVKITNISKFLAENAEAEGFDVVISALSHKLENQTYARIFMNLLPKVMKPGSIYVFHSSTFNCAQNYVFIKKFFKHVVFYEECVYYFDDEGCFFLASNSIDFLSFETTTLLERFERFYGGDEKHVSSSNEKDNIVHVNMRHFPSVFHMRPIMKQAILMQPQNETMFKKTQWFHFIVSKKDLEKESCDERS